MQGLIPCNNSIFRNLTHIKIAGSISDGTASKAAKTDDAEPTENGDADAAAPKKKGRPAKNGVAAVKKEVKMDPMSVVYKAIGHESFQALKVYD